MADSTEKTESFQNGFCAHGSGVNKHANPYSHRGENISHREWLCGWETAAALTASGTKSDGGAEVASSTALATRGEQRDRTHGMMPAGDNAETSVCTDRSPSDPITSQPDEVEAIARLLTAAKLLQQHAVGCATNHHGHDCELNGLPGWLADTKNNIDAAEDAILAMLAERRGDTYTRSQLEAHAAEQVRAEREMLDEFGKHRNWELAHRHPVYGDDDDQSEYWAVFEQSGPINDREWNEIARGDTPHEALSAAAIRARGQV